MAKRFVTTKVEVEGREETKVVELHRASRRWDETPSFISSDSAWRASSIGKSHRRRALRRHPAPRNAVRGHFLAAHRARRITNFDLALLSSALPACAAPSRSKTCRREVDGVRLFDRNVHYANQPIAAIGADSPEIAERALHAIACGLRARAASPSRRRRPLPARRNSVHRQHRGNSPRVATRATRRWAFATPISRSRNRTPVALHTALEPHGAVAEWSGGLLTVWESTQGIFNTRADVAKAFKLPLSSVRVIKNYMGGGFGAKNGAPHSTYIAVALARKVGRPVRCILDREGEQTDAGNRPATIQRVTLGAKRDGSLTAIKLEATTVLGIGGWLAGPGRIYHEWVNARTCILRRRSRTPAQWRRSVRCSAEGAFGLEVRLTRWPASWPRPARLRRRTMQARSDKDRVY